MKSAVVDTNVLSEVFNGDSSLIDLLGGFESICIPVTVLGELLFGFLLGTRERENRQRLDQFLSQPSVDVVDLSSYTAEYYALLMTALRKKGTPLPTNDVWIAAAACSEKVPLVSRDKHFLNIPGLQLIVPE